MSLTATSLRAQAQAMRNYSPTPAQLEAAAKLDASAQAMENRAAAEEQGAALPPPPEVWEGRGGSDSDQARDAEKEAAKKKALEPFLAPIAKIAPPAPAPVAPAPAAPAKAPNYSLPFAAVGVKPKTVDVAAAGGSKLTEGLRWAAAAALAAAVGTGVVVIAGGKL